MLKPFAHNFPGPDSGVLRLLVPLLFLVSFSSANAFDLRFRYIYYDNDSIISELVIQDSLPPEISRYIGKGIPVTFGYRVELWKSRAGWFDKLTATFESTFRLRYDTWAKRYTVIQEEADLTIEHMLSKRREATELITSTDRISLPISDTTDIFYLIGKLTIETMSLSNFKEVESWLKGEISSARKPNLESAPNKIGEFLFKTALKISGLKNISKEIKTENFRIGDLPIKPER